MDLHELLWNLLEPTEQPETRRVSEALLERLYQFGFADYKRISLSAWKQGFQRFPKSEDGIMISKGQIPSLNPLLFKGMIKKPFDPQRLKDGPRPLPWLTELYQKVLQFETTLKLLDWQKVVEKQIQPKFRRGDRIVLNAGLKALLAQLLELRPSPLRRLELLGHEGRGWQREEGPKAEKKAPPPVIIQDKYEAKPKEILEKAAIDKLYYHFEKQPVTDDADNLSFLDELAKSEKEDENL